MTNRSRRRQRGAALILAVIVIMLAAVIGVGVLRIGQREVAGASAAARRQALVSCAEAARQLLVSQLHALGADPTTLTALNLPLDGTAGGTARAVGGHIGEDPTAPTQVQVTQITKLPPSAFGPPSAVSDLSNVIVNSSVGGNPYKVTAHCVDHGDGTPAGGRQLEIEFGVRFGL
jgi:type II secretory pathway pseudopilin PulG